MNDFKFLGDVDLPNGSYFSITIVKDGKAFQSPLRNLVPIVTSVTDIMYLTAVHGQEKINEKLNTLRDI